MATPIETNRFMKNTTILFSFFFQMTFAFAQHFGMVIKGGQVIDPKNHINEILDIAISDGKIVKIASDIDTKNASQVIDAGGMYVVPGLIDIHTHDFYGTDSERYFCNGTSSLMPDGFSFSTGVTTVVDAGSSGWKDFPVFKKKIIDGSKTRVLAFLNIVGAGMRGGAYEQDTRDMDWEKTARVAQEYRNYIVGIKLAHYKGAEWKPVDQAISAGNKVNMPVMIDFGESVPPLSIQELFLTHMRPGDIFTHCFAELSGRESIVDTGTKKLKPFVWAAKKRGIIYDLGCGEISFSFSQAIPAVKAGFYPNSISTDMHANKKYRMNDMLDLMSKFLALGMSIPEVIGTVTWNPAREIRHEELGNISEGAIADLAILQVCNDNIIFYDDAGYKIDGKKRFECETTIKSGKIVYRLN
jgi:dihydroorotase